MRRKILTIVLAALAIALTVPLGTALTLERHASAQRALASGKSGVQLAPVLALAEASSLFLGGGLLIGLASLVRRSS